FNVYDGVPYPWGWGIRKDGSLEPDLCEPIQLIRELQKLGVNIVNVAVGNPYYNPHLERPYDHPIEGGYLPEEHPLQTISRIIRITSDIHKEVPEVHLVGGGISWLRQFFPNVGAAMIQKGWISFLGVGRCALANPGFANQLFQVGSLDFRKICIVCSSCVQMMRDGVAAGCPIRDSKVYGSIYRAGRLKNEHYVRKWAKECTSCTPPPCQGGCPAGMDTLGFIQAFIEGDVKKSYTVMRKDNPLPETCAYVCPSEVLCEARCASSILEKRAIPIRQIQKLVAQQARIKGYTRIVPGNPTGKRIAVVGFGPAGVACSTYLVEKGHTVSVFEAQEQDGGLVATHIPAGRIGEGILQAEVDALGLKELDLFEIRYAEKIGEDFSLDSLLREGYHAVFLGMGLQESVRLREDNIQGVVSAFSFLRELKVSKKNIMSIIQGKQVAVIGGGTTGLDAALEALDCGAEDVYVLYRRSLKQMPAWVEKRQEAMDKGVHFLFLAQPVEYIVDDNNRLSGIKVAPVKLESPDITGRRSPMRLNSI
ncbi:FAD-dependent oxidoreductase, partial [Candidatus Aerophobetes bacterium]|nr:FAD-dependent oxidoreductase [Candidatus Aerophobetes bacterium]